MLCDVVRFSRRCAGTGDPARHTVYRAPDIILGPRPACFVTSPPMRSAKCLLYCPFTLLLVLVSCSGPCASGADWCLQSELMVPDTLLRDYGQLQPRIGRQLAGRGPKPAQRLGPDGGAVRQPRHYSLFGYIYFPSRREHVMCSKYATSTKATLFPPFPPFFLNFCVPRGEGDSGLTSRPCLSGADCACAPMVCWIRTGLKVWLGHHRLLRLLGPGTVHHPRLRRQLPGHVIVGAVPRQPLHGEDHRRQVRVYRPAGLLVLS